MTPLKMKKRYVSCHLNKISEKLFYKLVKYICLPKTYFGKTNLQVNQVFWRNNKTELWQSMWRYSWTKFIAFMLPSQKQFRRIVPKIMIDHDEVDQSWFWPNFEYLNCFQNYERINYDAKKFDRVDTSRSSFYSYQNQFYNI